MYSLTFRLNLKQVNDDISQTEIDNIANTKSTYISLLGSSLIKKHGDVFTLYGQQAVYLKNLMDTGQISGVEIYTPPVIPAAPTVTTDNLTVSSWNCHVYGTVVSQGTSNITEYGFVYAARTNYPTIENNKEVIGTGSFTGAFDAVIDVGPSVDGIEMFGGIHSVWFAAYATNDVGTSYGEILQSNPNPWLCLMAGTSVALPNNTYKNIEDIDYEDDLLVWNFDEAKLDQTRPVWIMKPFFAPRYALIKFSDGSSLGTIDDGKGHSIFNIEKGKFTHMMSSDTPIGTTTYASDGSKITVISKEIIHEEVSFHNVITNFHMNLFANNILTSTTLNNIYPISDMRFIKDDREILDCSDELLVGLRGSEQPVDISSKVALLKKQQLFLETTYTP